MDDTNSTTLNTNDLDDSEDGSIFCEICNERYPVMDLLACFKGHFFCQNCYQQEYYKGKEARCPHFTCNAWIDHANCGKLHSPEVNISNKMFPNACFYVTGRVSSWSFSRMSETSIPSSKSKTSRPLSCPLKSCNKAIAVKSVDYHFECEHKHVASITTHLEARNGMEFLAEDIKINDVLCICLIRLQKPEDCNTRLKREKSSKTSLSSMSSSNPVLLIMATRLLFDCTHKYCDCKPAERYFIWMSSNNETNFNYTIALSSQCNRFRVKYFGPLPTMSENFKTLCVQNKGLTLTRDRIVGMTGGFHKPLVLDILIHGPS